MYVPALIFLLLSFLSAFPLLKGYLLTGFVPRFPSLIVSVNFTVISILLFYLNIK